MPIEIFVDADACPVKDEIYRVAQRYGVKVYVVANSFMRVPRDESIEPIVVGADSDAADDWIAARAGPGAIIVTSDISAGEPWRQGRSGSPRCDGQALHREFDRHGARQPRPDGSFARERRDDLRPAAISPRDRSNFLGALDNAIVR